MKPSERRELEMSAGRRTVADNEARLSPEDLLAANTTADRIGRLRTFSEWTKEKKCLVEGVYLMVGKINNYGAGNSNIELLRSLNDAANVKVRVGNMMWSEEGRVFPSAILFANVALAIGAGQHETKRFSDGVAGGFGG